MAMIILLHFTSYNKIKKSNKESHIFWSNYDGFLHTDSAKATMIFIRLF